MMYKIGTRDEFVAFGLGGFRFVHEPDQWGCSARVEGAVFDNAGHWPMEALYGEGRAGWAELHVVFVQDGVDVACVNLLELCAWVMGAEHA